MADVSIIVADTSRMTAIRDGVKLPGRCMHFNSGSLASAMESIRAYRPKIVAIDAVVDNAHASLIDISILGAQIVSVPALRPNQKIKIGLPDTDDILNVVASVAWSMFELSGEPRYRVGIEFSGAAQQALEEYRLRHCADTPIGPRG